MMLTRLLRVSLPAILAATFGLQLAHADIYTWVDASGSINVSNLAPPDGVRAASVMHESAPATATSDDAARDAARRASSAGPRGARSTARGRGRACQAPNAAAGGVPGDPCSDSDAICNQPSTTTGAVLRQCGTAGEYRLRSRVDRLRALEPSRHLSNERCRAARILGPPPAPPLPAAERGPEKPLGPRVPPPHAFLPGAVFSGQKRKFDNLAQSGQPSAAYAVIRCRRKYDSTLSPRLAPARRKAPARVPRRTAA